MSISMPKRVEDLSPLDLHDNLKTPMRNSFTDTTSTTKTSLFPKRISELSPLESSDDEDQNNENRDVLNDSFVCTPSSKLYGEIENNLHKDYNLSSLERKLSCIPEENENNEKKRTPTNEVNDGKTSISRQLKFSNISITEKIAKDKPQISLFSRIKSNSSAVKVSPRLNVAIARKSPTTAHTSRRIAFSQKVAIPVKTNSLEGNISHDSSLSGKVAVDVKRTVSAPLKTNLYEEKTSTRLGNTTKSNSFEDKTTASVTELSTPKLTSLSDESSNRSTVDLSKIDGSTVKNASLMDETPYKAFQMPSTRRLLSTHRSILSSNTGNKCRSALENEFRSQKVLFTTPSAVSRPAIQVMSNLGLDDSLQLHCYKSSPAINNQKEERQLPKLANDPIKSSSGANTTADMPILDNAVTSSTGDVKEEKGPKILQINGKEFVVSKKIGQGGSSSVFLAEHKDSKLECAVKVVDLRGDPALIEGYVKEVKILASLQDKKNVIRLYEYALVSSENLLFMVMEKGDSDLRKILQDYKTSLPLYTLMNLWHQMLQAVHYIHKNDVIHSDLKPENFLMVNGRLKLIDFGISSNMAVDATSIIKYSQVGTFNYISPEALMDTSTGNSPMARKNQPKIKISTKSDVWSLGCILYLLLYKKTPFAHIKNIYAKMQAIIDPNKQIDYPTLPHYYPSMLTEMAQQCLRHNPKQRASVADLLNFPFHMVVPLDSQN